MHTSVVSIGKTEEAVAPPATGSTTFAAASCNSTRIMRTGQIFHFATNRHEQQASAGGHRIRSFVEIVLS